MKINRSNYEVFFLDYHEGRLGAHDVAELMVFLEAHPDLKAELEEFDVAMRVPGEELRFEHKDVLKRQPDGTVVNLENYEHYFVAFLEKDLSVEEETQLTFFLAQHPELRP